MNIKIRLKQYLDLKSISDYRFQKDIGVTNGYLTKGDTIRSDYLEKILAEYKDLNVMWLLTGMGDMTISNSGGIQGDNSIQNTGTMANSYVGSGNYINVSLPDKGTQKIIKPNGTVEIVSANPEAGSGIVAEGSPLYGIDVKNLQEKVSYLQDQVNSYKDIIEEQKEIIKLLKDNRK